jgi:hypothetical protein
MNGNYETQELPCGRTRARAHSMLFTFKTTSQEQENAVEPQYRHLPLEHSDEGTVHDLEKAAAGSPTQYASVALPGGGRVASGSRVSKLTMGLQVGCESPL